MISTDAAQLEGYIRFAMSHEEKSIDKDLNIHPYANVATRSSLSTDSDAVSSATSDPHAVSLEEAYSYYYGLYSRPKLLYRTSKTKWVQPVGPWEYPPPKELCEVFTHPIAKVWNNDLGWKVVEVLDARGVS